MLFITKDNLSAMEIANQTVAIIEDGFYIDRHGDSIQIELETNDAFDGTVYYPERSSILTDKVDPVKKCTIVVTDETTSQAAQRILAEGISDNVVALNFASATRPGGGWLAGAIAQEEDLARSSALEICLESHPEYYNINKDCKSGLYTDGILYSPKVPFFRNPDMSLTDQPYLVSIITSPAPNLRKIAGSDKKLVIKAIEQRTIKILEVAAKNNHKAIILGAWGCGVFCNEPDMVAHAFKNALKVVPAFDYVCFAVYDLKPGKPILESFKRVLGV